MNELNIKQIVNELSKKFPSFGGGKISEFNPLTNMLADNPPMFAAGVDIKEVVVEILKIVKEMEG